MDAEKYNKLIEFNKSPTMLRTALSSILIDIYNKYCSLNDVHELVCDLAKINKLCEDGKDLRFFYGVYCDGYPFVTITSIIVSNEKMPLLDESYNAWYCIEYKNGKISVEIVERPICYMGETNV